MSFPVTAPEARSRSTMSASWSAAAELASNSLSSSADAKPALRASPSSKVLQSPTSWVRATPSSRRVALIRSNPTRSVRTSVAALSLNRTLDMRWTSLTVRPGSSGAPGAARAAAREGVFDQLWSSDGVVSYIPDGGQQRRMAVAVRAGGEILGSIWAADGGKPFEPSAEAALVEAAAIAALHLVRHRTSEDIERRMRRELLCSLLEGRGPLDIVAARLGMETETSTTVGAFELRGGDDPGRRASPSPIR